ncbi:cobalt ECF transporter T component CbiQ [Desulfurobacterium indicum]|uniref:Cobalt ECF transporter T component CbiQ n=1 Tax=Desulfurobacterium indicum TaxID=1914305 RepID=A0A1R1MJ73_9BACT|nr:cobalt ECF transporter T component CbiQ [Desulfurobacterium indicum]OMH39847.1 cobalt ECF transporter T component CbiQ [Desulfurobacterium indicum]
MENKLAEGKTLLHKLDPRVKIIVFLMFAVSCALSSSISFLLFSSIFILILGFIVRYDLTKALKSLLFADSFLIFLIITMIFTYDKGNRIKLGIISFYPEGLKYGAFLFFKSNVILLFMLFLLATSTVFEIAHALHHLKVPPKLVQILFFTFRYIHVIRDEYKRLLKAAIARGFKPATNVHTYKTYGYIVANLIIRSHMKADRIYKAMLCRGFKGEFPVYRHFRLEKKDIIFTTFSFLFLITAFTGSEIWKF